MKHFTFKSYLTSNIEIGNAELDKLLGKCDTKKVQAGSLLLQPGEHCQYSFFVESGLLRLYSIDRKGKEHTLQFAPESWFITERDSAYFNRPSKYFIQALEDSVFYLIEEEQMVKLSQMDRSFNAFNNRLLHNHIRRMQDRINLLLSATAEERYIEFIRLYPDILLRVPQAMIAGYLGITPESLSRVRKELAGKNYKSV